MKHILKNVTFVIFAALSSILFSSSALHAEGGPVNPVYVGFDGSYGVKNSTSSKAIELGLRAAMHEINAAGGVLGGRPLELITKDNRSVAARGLVNLEEFAAIEDLVAVIGDRFSPVLLQQIEPAHAKQMPLLDVWAAADDITEHAFTPSYTFRLSLKDSWAMPAMLKQALAKGGNKIGVLLPNTGWGRSNQKALEAALAHSPQAQLVGSIWYNWGEQDMLQHYRSLLSSGAQSVLFVTNDLEGSLLVRQLGERPDVLRVPIISHWGVTGGDMVEASGPALAGLDFSFVQTFSFARARPQALAAFKKTVKEMAGIDDLEKLASPVGVGHGYDMMHILAKAIDTAGSTNRATIRDALENLGPHNGLVRDYNPPFSANNHEALGPELVFFAKYGADGMIVPVEP
ncbi:MAG: ABC transporter substrate-binding protein [Rhodospirillales bacterium]|nr:ABC transporter substrate-binding protein [Rhodospirillales bacterium]